MTFFCHAIRKEKLEHLPLTVLIPGKQDEGDNDKHTCNSSVKAQPLLSMTHMTEKHGKRLLMRQSMSGSDRNKMMIMIAIVLWLFS